MGTRNKTVLQRIRKYSYIYVCVQIYECSVSRICTIESLCILNLEGFGRHEKLERTQGPKWGKRCMMSWRGLLKTTHQESDNLMSLGRNEAELVMWWQRRKSIGQLGHIDILLVKQISS